MPSLSFDLVMLADLRRRFAPAWQLAGLLAAQSAAGYRTAIIQLDGPHGRKQTGIDPAIRDLIDSKKVVWHDPDVPANASVLIAVDPALMLRPADLRLRLDTAAAYLWCDRPVLDGSQGAALDLQSIRDHLEEFCGTACSWIPANSLIRAELARLADLIELAPFDWTPVLDVAAWTVEAPLIRGARPVIGLQAGLDGALPGVAEPALRALRSDPRLAVHLHGDPAALRRACTPWPAGWRAQDASTTSLAAYLQGVDFHLQPHVVGQTEPLAFAALAAAAAGVFPIASPGLRPYLQTLALYAEPKDMARVIVSFYGDQQAMAERRERARIAVEEGFGLQVHARRLSNLIGPPRPAPAALQRPGGGRMKRRVLFVSTNGVGMGHLTRQLAIARRLDTTIEPVFLSMSQAFDIVRQFGFMVEFTPYHAYYGGKPIHWNAHLARLLEEMIAFYDARAVVFDGNVPFQGLLAASRRHAGRRFIWCRRPFWLPGQDPAAVGLSRDFDLVLEPAELGAIFDRGPTRADQVNVRPIGPIRLLDPNELLSRAEAAEALGLDPEKPTALLQLGARNNYDLAPLIDRLLPALRRVPELQIVAAHWLIAENGSAWPAFVRSIERYPLARYFNTFDFTIAAPGYNTFHDVVACGLPAIFVPNENPRMDDHVGRAAFAERHGFGLSLRRTELYKVDTILRQILDPNVRAAMRAAAARFQQINGAAEAASAIEELLLAVRCDLDQAWLRGLHRRRGTTLAEPVPGPL